MSILDEAQFIELLVLGGQTNVKEENITRVSLEEWGEMKGKTNWKKIKAMTEEEIEANALSYPDSQPLPDNYEKPYLDQCDRYLGQETILSLVEVIIANPQLQQQLLHPYIRNTLKLARNYLSFKIRLQDIRNPNCTVGLLVIF